MKPSKIQKRWIADWAGDDPHLDYLLDFLLKLRIIKRYDHSVVRNGMYSKVRDWYHKDLARKERHLARQEDKSYHSKPPKSIKPTRARF